MIYTWHRQAAINTFLFYTPVLCIILSISASTLTSIAISLIAKGDLVVRHLVYGPVAGAIIGGASSYYTTNPVYAIVVGVTGGALQTIFMLIKQNRVENGMRPFTTISWSLFGIQGFIGSAYAVCWKEIVESNSDGLSYTAIG